MIKFLLKRIPAFLVSVAGIIIIGFCFSRFVPGDPVQRMIQLSGSSPEFQTGINNKNYDQLYRKLNYHLPVFYITWSSRAVPDSFYYLPQKERRDQLIQLSAESGVPDLVYDFRMKSEQLFSDASQSPEKNTEAFFRLRNILHSLMLKSTIVDIEQIISTIQLNNADFDSAILIQFEKIKSSFTELKKHNESWKHWIPCVGFTTSNQFHSWLLGSQSDRVESGGIIRGDLGNSTVSNKPVLTILKKPFFITFVFSIIALLISILISVTLATWLVTHKQLQIARIIPGLLLFIYSIPFFVMAVVLLMLFANNDMLNIFPSSGISPAGGFPHGSGIIYRLFHTIPYFILPLIAYVYGSIAFFTRLLLASLNDQLNTDHIRTARAKGLSEKIIVGHHALRNSLIPLITTASSAFAVMVSGAVLMENIFSIPGMGTELVRAVQNQDYPVMTGFFLIMAITTVLIFAVTDLLYAYFDPRIKLENGN